MLGLPMFKTPNRTQSVPLRRTTIKNNHQVGMEGEQIGVHAARVLENELECGLGITKGALVGEKLEPLPYTPENQAQE
jgi:hypothetical protein